MGMIANIRRIASHLAALRSGVGHGAMSWSADLDLAQDIKRVNDHLVASAAYPILDGRGVLLDSRVAESL